MKRRGGGGSAAAAGLEFQARVAARCALAVLLREPANVWLDMPRDAVWTSIRCETAMAVDDVLVCHSIGGAAFIQAKHRVDFSDSPTSHFGKAIIQLATQFRIGARSQYEPSRPIDPGIDRLVLAVGSSSSKVVTKFLPELLLDLASRDSTNGLAAGDRGSARATMLEKLRGLLAIAWQAQPTDREVRDLAKVLRVRVHPEGDGTEEADALYRSGVVIAGEEAPAAWQALLSACIGFAIARGGGNRDVLAQCVGRVARLRPASDGPQDPDEELRHYLDAVRRTAGQHPWRPRKGLSFATPPALGTMYIDQELVDRTPSPLDAVSGARQGPDQPPAVGTIEQALQRYRHLVVSGHPGVGKSSLLRHLADTLGTAWSEGSALSLPVLLHARHLAYRKPLTEAIQDGARDQLGSRLLRDLPSRMLGPAANLILLIDGIDEIQGDLRDAAIDAFTEIARVPTWRFVATSRPFPGGDLEFVRMAHAGDLGELELRPFDKGQARSFINVFLERTGAPGRLAEHIMEHLRRLGFPWWTLTPLALEMLCQLVFDSPDGRLPANRALLYKAYVDAVPWRPREALTTDAERAVHRWCRELLAAAAWESCQTDELSLLDFADEWVRSNGEAAPPGTPAPEWRRILHDVLCGTGLVVSASGTDGVTFAHQTLSEYLAACHLAASLDPAEPEIPGWGGYDSYLFGYLSEIIVFLAGILAAGGRDVDLLAEHVLSNASREDGLAIIGRFLEESLPLGPRTVAALRVVAGAWQEESGHRIEAIEALAAVDPVGSATVLLAAAVDPDMDQPERVMVMRLLAPAPAPVRAALTWIVSEFGWNDLDLQYRSEAWPLLDRRADPRTRAAGLRLVLAAPEMGLDYRIAAAAELSTEGDDRAYRQVKSLTDGWELVEKLVEAVRRGASPAALDVLERLAVDPDVDSSTRSDASDELDFLIPGRR